VELIGGVWFVKMVKGTSGWFGVCMGDRVDNRCVVVHDKTNGWWERQGSMRYDELGDMGHLVPMKKELIKNTCPIF
jgi:hypothetical protein